MGEAGGREGEREVGREGRERGKKIQNFVIITI